MAGGGAERQLIYLSGELVRRGWDVHVAVLKEGPNFERLIATGTSIHKIPSRGNHDITILWHLMKLIRTVRPDLVQTWITQMDILGGIASRLTGTPFILSERSCSAAYPPSFKHSLRVSAGRHAAAIVSNSFGGKQYWQMQTGNGGPIYVVHNALPLGDIEKNDQSVCDLRVPPNSKVLLVASRFVPGKNIDSIIRAFKIVLTQQDAVLVLCGEGKIQPQIEEMVRKENLRAHVILPGYVQNLWELMKRADLFISVSTFEGQPNTVLEAMACGCPLILSDITAHRAFLDEEGASFVDPGSVTDIARAILTCMENPERTKQMALNAKSKASSYSISAVADEYEIIYDSIRSH
jgi:glycosyltransferase involved in cell wall biosynthesis